MAIVRDSMAHLRPVKRQPVALARCLALALKRAGPLPGVKIIQTDLENLPRAIAGEQQVEMVFFNLIDNAVKAMAGQGELHFRGTWAGDEVMVSVTDTGPGIPPEIQPRIFEFSPSPMSAEPQRGRLGFGLWWVKALLDRFDGRIVFDSQPGQGTTFKVYLPAEKGW
jgi:signal transduction histidine kinase